MISAYLYSQPAHQQQIEILAQNLFYKARHQSWLDKIRSILGKRTCHLLDLAQIQATCTELAQRDIGKQSVTINQIKGSANAGRCRDFDAAFRLLQTHNKSRWLSVAEAWLRGVNLPPVRLIRVGGVYFVQDGHHRISVAKALGNIEVEAKVTEWQVIGILPWERCENQKRPFPMENAALEQVSA